MHSYELLDTMITTTPFQQFRLQRYRRLSKSSCIRDILTLLSMADAGNILYQFVNVADVYDFAYLVVDLHARTGCTVGSTHSLVTPTNLLSTVSLPQSHVVDYKTHPSIDNVTENLSKYATDDDMSIQNSGNTWASTTLFGLKHSFEGPDLYEDGFDTLVEPNNSFCRIESNIYYTVFVGNKGSRPVL